MKPELANNMLRFVEVSSALGKRAVDEVTEIRGAQKTAAERIPGLVQQMVDSGVLGKNQTDTMTTKLASHNETLAILGSAVTKLAEAKAELAQLKSAHPKDRLGAAEKQASDGGSVLLEKLPNTVVVGAHTSNMMDSDRRLFNGLGLERLVNKEG